MQIGKDEYVLHVTRVVQRMMNEILQRFLPEYAVGLVPLTRSSIILRF